MSRPTTIHRVAATLLVSGILLGPALAEAPAAQRARPAPSLPKEALAGRPATPPAAPPQVQVASAERQAWDAPAARACPALACGRYVILGVGF
ncbi:hypothetical protein [uncultured Alsobacter sp.]|uniref:hypothetical protein n=1 Tax=uncultured Alsobacter sp. TaxID=1748258 RepID=UPI0025CF76F8|nr:hypothetical protein [uncultured Alsobacter sp.]